MLQSAAQIASSLPNAFAALAVGTLSSAGIYPLSILFRTEYGGSYSFSKFMLENVAPERHAIHSLFVGFTALFLVYALGLMAVLIGDAMRKATVGGQNPNRAKVLVLMENAFVERLYFEVKSLSSICDGLGMGLFAFLVGNGISFLAHGEWIATIALVCSGFGICYFFFHLSKIARLDFDDTIDQIARASK
ncbi:hypothetical protein [Roseovarius sp. A-2]|uniref:hypothetical protein n=1 Tax=Roseovarius sp. A-2 TaxID=1570360 RepID=UPI001119D790|nr:hypothetical protein [Roseovarius sp. A-2]